MKAAILLLAGALLFAASEAGAGSTTEGLHAPKIRIVFSRQEVIVKMLDNPASRDFLSLLPLTLEFSDYAGAEKIASLPRRLRTDNTPTPRDATGDFTYYAPWGNLAVFYKGSGSDGQLYVLGRIESGKEKLGTLSQNITATIEVIE